MKNPMVTYKVYFLIDTTQAKFTYYNVSIVYLKRYPNSNTDISFNYTIDF